MTEGENPMKQVSMTVVAFLMAAITFPAAADEVTYRKHVRPLFQKQCASCHGADAPYLGEFKQKRMSTSRTTSGLAWTPTRT